MCRLITIWVGARNPISCCRRRLRLHCIEYSCAAQFMASLCERHVEIMTCLDSRQDLSEQGLQLHCSCRRSWVQEGESLLECQLLLSVGLHIKTAQLISMLFLLPITYTIIQ